MNSEQDPQFEKVTSTLHGWSDEASPNLAPAILAQIRANRRRRTWLALAASLALLVGAGYWATRTSPEATITSASSAFPVETTIANVPVAEPSPVVNPAAAPIAPVIAPPSVPEDPGDTDIAMARGWLLSAQDPDGGWRMGRTGASANYTVGTSALALLALLNDGASSRDAIDRGVTYLASEQRPSGLFGPEITGSLYNHALACLALMRAGQGSDSLARGLALLAASQRPEGGWTYLRAQGPPNASLTVWALLVLTEAQRNQPGSFTDSINRGLAWLQQTIDAEGRAGYRRAGDYPNGSETLTAAVALCFLQQQDGIDERLRHMLANVRHDMNHDGETIDLYRTFFQVAALRAMSPSDGELNDIENRLRALQDHDGDDAGSWPPLDRWSTAGGRVYSTSLALLALNES